MNTENNTYPISLDQVGLDPNIILETDSYKLGHWDMYEKDTQYVKSYFESRKGAKYDYTPFLGLQQILIDHLQGVVVTRENIEEAAEICREHFGDEKMFNREMWEHILNVHGGKLPIRIRAVAEGTPIPVSNVLMTVENTDPKCASLTNALESILTHVWYPSTVCAKSRFTKQMIKKFLEETADNTDLLVFKLHDFGYRGAATAGTAAIGGLAHIVNFMGTDTVPAMRAAKRYYGASYKGLAYSVPATEHSIMTSLGKEGEMSLVNRFLDQYPDKILSVVADSFNYCKFVKTIATEPFRSKILARKLPFVVRPDSVTPDLTTPEDVMLWTMQQLEADWGVTVNTKGYKVINAPVRVLWGDGIDVDGIEKILQKLKDYKYSADNIATFGMGGGLLQKVNRDTQRFAFKSCAQMRSGVWYDIYKEPLDPSKTSKRGHLKLVRVFGAHSSTYTTKQTVAGDYKDDELVIVFENGEIKRLYTFDEVRANAAVR